MLKHAVSLAALLFTSSAVRADGIDKEQLARIDSVVDTSLKRHDCPGAVVLIVHGDEVVFRKSYGSCALKPEKAAMTLDTVFDMASLTKPVATGTSVLLLIEQGKLKPDDLVSKHWPSFAAKDRIRSRSPHFSTHPASSRTIHRRLRRRRREGHQASRHSSSKHPSARDSVTRM